MSDKLVCEWKLSEPVAEMAFAIVEYINNVVRAQAPDLIDLFPLRNAWHAEVCLGEDWIALSINEQIGGGIPVGGEMSDVVSSELKALISPLRKYNHQELYDILGEKWFGFNKFTYVGPYQAPNACWPDVAQHVVDWLNHLVAPEVLQRNRARVLRAVPDLSQNDQERIMQSLWVLECEETSLQGTAFYLRDIGLVTCDHVLGTHTYAFKPQSHGERYPVKVVIRDKGIDLAILRIDAPLGDGLLHISADDVQQMQGVFAFGFPNYRYGDTGLITRGHITGFRSFSGVRHILTSAPLIAGNSGGPVVDVNGNVIGVVVTGADRIENAQKTEKHGIIPIDAIDYLLEFLR